MSCPRRAALIGIDVADHVGDRHVRRGQLLDVALRRDAASAMGVSSPASASRSRQRRQIGRYGLSWISQPCDVRRPFVEQRGEHADQARLGLAAQARAE